MSFFSCNFCPLSRANVKRVVVGGGEGDRERGANVNDRDGTSSLWLSRFLSAALTFEKRTKTEDSLHCSEGGEEEGEGKREREGEVEGLVESELELQVNSLFSWANVTTLQQIEVSLPTPPVDNALSSQLPTGPPSLLPLILSPSFVSLCCCCMCILWCSAELARGQFAVALNNCNAEHRKKKRNANKKIQK